MRTLFAAVLSLAIAAPALAGSVSGPQVASTQVLAQSTDSFAATFRGGESTTVAISGDGDTDLDLYVYDENGNLVASDLGSSDQAVVTFTPAWTGGFRIEVKNRGYVYNEYVLITD